MPVESVSSGVSSMRSRFDASAKKHIDAQKNCVFSGYEGAGPRKLRKGEEGYGRPEEGSQSARRAEKAQRAAMAEVEELCELMWACADWREEGRAFVTFERLFKLYLRISDKLVGTLIRARKHGYVTFEGEMLYQRRDEDKIIELTHNINTIRVRFGQPPAPDEGGEVEVWVEGRGKAPPTFGSTSNLTVRRPMTRTQSLNDLNNPSLNGNSSQSINLCGQIPGTGSQSPNPSGHVSNPSGQALGTKSQSFDISGPNNSSSNDPSISSSSRDPAPLDLPEIRVSDDSDQVVEEADGASGGDRSDSYHQGDMIESSEQGDRSDSSNQGTGSDSYQLGKHTRDRSRQRCKSMCTIDES